jgi:hypothetical protein
MVNLKLNGSVDQSGIAEIAVFAVAEIREIEVLDGRNSGAGQQQGAADESAAQRGRHR